jgi:hypothetical protein
MLRMGSPLKRTAIALMLVNAVTVAVVAACFVSARHAAQATEETLVAFANDVTRVSQAQVTAERMVAIGRGYLLTTEPELLARAQAAEVMLARTLQTVIASAHGIEERRGLDPLLAAARRYREVFSDLLSGKAPPRDPKAIADSLRKSLIPARDDLLGRLDALAAEALKRMVSARALAHEERSRSLALMLSVGILGGLLSMFMGWLVSAGTVSVTPAETSVGWRSARSERMRTAFVTSFGRQSSGRPNS